MTQPNNLVKTLKFQGVALVLAFLSLAVAGISISQSMSAQSHTKALAVCRQNAVDSNSRASAIRNKITNDTFVVLGAQIKADNDFIVQIVTGPQNLTDGKSQALVAEFLATNKMLVAEQAALDEERQSNPVPPPPDVQCK